MLVARTWPVLLAVLLAAALLLLLKVGPGAGEDPVRAARGEPGEPAAPDAVVLEGRPAPPEASRTAGPEQEGESASADGSGAAREFEVRGIVRARAGEVLADAHVFLLPKSRSGGFGPVPVTYSEEDGTWSLGTVAPAGSWLGVVVEGHLPLHVDGDSLRPGETTVCEVEPGPELTVFVRGPAGPVPAGTTVQLHPVPQVERDGPPYPFPGPGEEWDLPSYGVEPDGRGVARLRVGTLGRFRVDAYQGAFLPVPEYVELPGPGGAAEFRMEPSCRLEVRVKDAATGEPFAQGFSFRVLDGDHVVNGGSTSLSGGSFSLGLGLRPGRYTVKVSSPWYRDAESEPVSFPTWGSTATAEVALERDLATGTLRVRIPALEPVTNPWLVVIARRRTDPPGPWAFTHFDRRDGPVDFLLEARPAGPMDLLVFHPKTRTVGLAAAVEVPGGDEGLTTVDLAAGVEVALRDRLPAPVPAASVRVGSSRTDGLPVYVASREWSSVDLYDEPERRLEPDLVLGPYPAREVEVTVTAADGTKRTSVHRR